MAQIDVLTNELNALRNEIVQTKANHAQLHQASVDANATSTRTFLEYGARINTVEKKMAELGETLVEHKALVRSH